MIFGEARILDICKKVAVDLFKTIEKQSKYSLYVPCSSYFRLLRPEIQR